MMGKIKAHLIERHKRSFLHHMRTQHLAQRCMQQVRRRMMTSGLNAPIQIHLRGPNTGRILG